MAIPFILHTIPCSSISSSFSKVRISPKVTIACYGFCLLCHTKNWLARDIISFHVYTLLHHELQDYTCFSSVICYHTAALPCKRIVNKRLLTSACKQA